MHESYDVTGKAVYVEMCRKLDVIPASYFLRHMKDTRLEMKHHGLGPAGVKPLAVSLVVRIYIFFLIFGMEWNIAELHHVLSHIIRLKLPSLFAAWLFWTFHTKSHNMKALVILSHSWSPFLPLTCLYGKMNFCGSMRYFRVTKLLPD